MVYRNSSSNVRKDDEIPFKRFSNMEVGKKLGLHLFSRLAKPIADFL